MSEFKGKERTDKVSERLYHKDFNSLVKSYSKINALATALKEAEEEIERLANGVETSNDKCTLHGVMPSLPADIRLKIDYHREKMEICKSVNDFQNALYHQQKIGTYEDIIIIIEGNGA